VGFLIPTSGQNNSGTLFTFFIQMNGFGFLYIDGLLRGVCILHFSCRGHELCFPSLTVIDCPLLDICSSSGQVVVIGVPFDQSVF
jgi:hypothetical protein